MSFDAISGLSGGNYALLNQATQSSEASQTSKTTATGAETQAGQSTLSTLDGTPRQPFLLVPTETLSPRILAELIGRQPLPF